MSMSEQGLAMKTKRKRTRKTGNTIDMVRRGYKKSMAKHGMVLDPFQPRNRSRFNCKSCGEYIPKDAIECPHCNAIDVED